MDYYEHRLVTLSDYYPFEDDELDYFEEEYDHLEVRTNG